MIYTSYFSFGQAHVHKLNDVILDKDILLKIVSRTPARQVMFNLFGSAWCNEIFTVPDDEDLANFYPRGIYTLDLT